MIAAITNDRCYEFRGLSTDTKPLKWNGIDISVGSIFFEIDSIKVYMFDGTAWVSLG